MHQERKKEEKGGKRLREDTKAEAMRLSSALRHQLRSCFCLLLLCLGFFSLAFQLLLLEFLASFHLVHKGLTHLLWQFAEASFAEGFALVIVHCTLERLAATVACEASRMPKLADGADTIVLDNLLATRTDLTEHLVVVELAVSLVLVLEVLALHEGLTTNAAAKTLWMPGARKSSERTTDDGLAATSANFLDELVVALVAVVLAVVLLAVATHEIAATRGATIVLWVNLLAVDDDVISHDGLLAESAKLVLCLTDLDTNDLALHAEWITLIFLVFDAKKAGTALGASKVLGVVSAVHETDALVDDGLLATVAALTEEIIVAVLAVHITLLLHELL